MAIEESIEVIVLNCGYTVPGVEKSRGQYREIFASLLQPAIDAALTQNGSASRHDRSIFTGYDVIREEYPPTLRGVRAVIISGSPHGVYEKLDWIQKLLGFIKYIYSEYPDIKIYGSCFGHQAVCEALFKEEGAIVEKYPGGWELGVHTIDVMPEFSRHFSGLLTSSSLRLQFLHGDRVLFRGGKLPSNIVLVGSTPHCPVQGIYQPGRLLTLQGHPEFDEFINAECLDAVGRRRGWDPRFTAAAVSSAQAGDDAAIAADVIVSFFLDK